MDDGSDLGMTTYSDEERERVIARAYELLAQDEAERPERERDMAEREARRLAGDEPREPELQPQRAASRKAERRRELPGWVALLVRQEVEVALRREAARLADGIGKVLAAERAQFRTINDALIDRVTVLEAEQRAASDNSGAVLDLSTERSRRSGGSAA
jgi:hypothetical protein